MECFAAGIAGLLSHWFLFTSGEWHLQATGLLKFYSLSYAVIVLLEATVRNIPWQQALVAGSTICAAYASCLWGSIITYRLFIHPLHAFPGPILARISKLWHVAQCYDSKNHLLMERMYAKYGSFVRTGMSNMGHHGTELD